MKASEIKPNPDNPRFIKDDKFQKLVQSLKEFPEMAVVRPVVINEDNVILGGNMRYKAMIEAGWTDIPITQVKGWTKEQEREFIIKDNVSGGEWDWETIANEWTDLPLEDWGLDLPDSFNDEEVEEDEVPEVSSEPPVSKIGEIYQLGRHRVICGDSTDRDSVAKLMQGKQANIVFTDPPYLMDFTGNVHGDGKKSFNSKHGSLMNDKLSEEDKLEFIDGFMANIKEFTVGAYYICWYRLGLHHLFNGIARASLEYRALIIWDKGNHTLSNSDYMSRYEPIVYGWVKDHKFYGGRSSFDLWQIDRTAKNELHPTMKPLALCAKAIHDGTETNGIVLDLFLGSGSTLIACEQTGRICYGMELDPKYVDVIRKRYAKFTNDNELPDNWAELTPVVQ